MPITAHIALLPGADTIQGYEIPHLNAIALHIAVYFVIEYAN